MNRLHFHTNRHNLTSKRQFGFRQQTSTVHAIHCALDIIKAATKNSEHVITVSLDIKSAFDTAWWPAIFQRLHLINCPKNIYRLLLDYTHQRRVHVNFADVSVNKTMTRGCIQGSVCGPTLWNLILDELLLTDLPDGCHLQAYADDVLLITHAKHLDHLTSITNRALNIITAWGEAVKLSFGPAKTQIIGFTNKATKCNIHIHGQKLHFVNQIKYLGIIIDRKLKFIQHANHTINKAKNLFAKLSTFIRPTWGVHPENVRTIYMHVLEPIIFYGASTWCKALNYKSVNKSLLSLQRLFAIKIIQGFRTISTAASISIAQLTPLPSKILEIADVEESKLRGVTRFLPDDVPIESPSRPSELLHPSLRTGITFHEITSIADLDQVDTSRAHQIYTDGSQHDDSVGAAFVVIDPDGGQIIKKLKLHPSCSVFQAELFAIERACAWILDRNIIISYIFSDSKSGLTELRNPNTHNHLAVKIHRHIHLAKLRNIDINFNWVKAHAGFAGNEVADTAAKAAASLHKRPDYLHTPISYIKFHNKALSRQASCDLYSDPNNCSYTKSLLPTHEALTKFLSIIKPDFAITQLLTNHGYHKTYLHRFKITSDNLCPCDDVTPQTLHHLIVDCPRFVKTRLDHEFITSTHNIDPFNINHIIDHESAIHSYHNHVTHIVKELKAFNRT